MERIGEEVHIPTQEARGGETRNVMRYVLAFSILLAIIALSTVWIVGAWQQAPSDGDSVSADEHALGG